MGQLCQLLDPDAGVPQHLHHRPAPEPAVFFEGQVTAFPGGRVFGPDPAGGLGLHHCPAQRLPAGGEQRACRGIPGGLQPPGGGGAPGIGPCHQGGQDGQPFPGPLVHAGLALGSVFLVGGLAGADRAARGVRPPQGRVIIGPFGDVEVEGPDRGHHAAAVQAGGHRLDAAAVAGGRRPGPGHHALLPRGRDVAGQPEGADAGLVRLKVGPEQLAEQVGQVLQRGEIQRHPAFGQVVDEHVADRPAGDVVTVDQLLARRLPAAGEHPHRRRHIVAERAPGAQQLVEERTVGVPVCRRQRLGCDVQQLHAVADGDFGGTAALGCHDDRDPAERDPPGVGSHRPGLAQSAQFSEGGGIPGAGHLGCQVPGRGRASQQPSDPGPDHVGADQHQQASADVGQVTSGGTGTAFPPVPDQITPVTAVFGAAGHPAILPAAAGLGFQPVHHRYHAKSPALLAERMGQRERRDQQPAEDLFAGGPGRRPRRRHRPCRERGQQLGAGPGQLSWSARPAGGRRGARLRGPAPSAGCPHSASSPNKTFRLSGR